MSIKKKKISCFVLVVYFLLFGYGKNVFGQNICKWEILKGFQEKLAKISVKTAKNKNLIKEIYFVDDENGWILGEGFIARTNNHGKDWKLQKFNSANLEGIHFADTNNKGWLTTINEQNLTKIYQTVDGGKTWKLMQELSNSFLKKNPAFSSSPSQILKVWFDNDQIIWSVGLKPISDKMQNAVWKTSDGGRKWGIKYITNDTAFKPKILQAAFKRLSDNKIIVSFDGSIILSEDDGQNWKEVYNNTDLTKKLSSENSQDIFTDFEFADEQSGWSVTGLNGIVFHSPDGGKTWTQQNLNIPHEESYSFTDIKFVDGQNGWLAGSRKDKSSEFRVILHTTDGGKNWSLDYQEQASLIIDMAKTPNYLYAIEDNGLILRRSIKGCS